MQKTSRKCYFFRPFLNPYSQSSLFPPETFSVNRHLQRHKNKSIQYAAKVGEEGEAVDQDGVYLVLFNVASRLRGKQKEKHWGKRNWSNYKKLLKMFHSSDLKPIQARTQFVHEIILMNLNMQYGQGC